MPKSVTVHYRRAVGRGLADLDFRACFDAGLNGEMGGIALRDADTARITRSSDGYRMCLIRPQIEEHFCFGEVAVFREGDVPIAQTEADGSVNLRHIVLEGNEQAIKGTSYFMARGPHLAILNHDSSTRFVEEYVRWLFRMPIGGLAPDDMVSLHSIIEVDGRAVALREVRALKIRAEAEAIVGHRPEVRADAGQPATFRRMIERRPLDQADVRSILMAIGMSNGSLNAMRNDDFEDLEFELLVRKKEQNRVAALPEHLIQGVVNDGLDRAAEFDVPGARRRGDAVVASYKGQVDVDPPYYNVNSVRALLWDALGTWANQGLI